MRGKVATGSSVEQAREASGYTHEAARGCSARDVTGSTGQLVHRSNPCPSRLLLTNLVTNLDQRPVPRHPDPACPHAGLVVLLVMSEPHRLSPRDARRIAIRAQLLTRERPGDTVETVREFTNLQIDPVTAVAPAQHLVLCSRLGSAYR